MKETTAFLGDKSPAGLTVYQITDDPKGAGLVYPVVPSFLADGRRFLVNTSTGPAICDPDDGCSLRPLSPNGAIGDMRITFDGRYGYYKHPQQEGDLSLTLSRIDLETLQSEEIFHAEGTLPGTSLPANRFNVSTVSVDNRRIASGSFLGDGTMPDAPYGILVLDLDCGSVRIVTEDRDFLNPHLQYCRSTDPEASHDLLIQMNHGAQTDEHGKCIKGLGAPSEGGVDIHVIRDDGANWRDLPFGRDGKESNIGHQIWRGTGQSAVTVTLQNIDNSYGWADGTAQEVVAGWPVPADKSQPHIGRLNPGTRRILLSEGFDKPRFCHLATDATGLKFVFDTFPIFDGRRAGMQIHIGSAPNEETPLTFHYILNSGVTFTGNNGYHAHPILSPDGSMLLFNSNMTGTPQAYLVKGYAY